MSDEEAFFGGGDGGDDGGDGDYSEGSGGSGEDESCCGKLCTAMILSILGCVLLPSSLFLCGWNEKTYVCEQKNILDADTNALPAPLCTTITGGYIAFNCAVDPLSYQVFTGQNFASQDTISFKGLSAYRMTETWWCIEEEHSSSSRRLESEEAEDVEASDRVLLSPRRLSSRRRSESKKYYTYHFGWTTSPQSFSDFHDQTKARNSCPNLPTASPTADLGQGTTQYAPNIKAGLYTITDPQNQDFQVDFVPNMPVDLSMATPGTPTPPATVRTKGQEGGKWYIYSCTSTAATPGCLRDSYMVNNAERVAALVEVPDKLSGITKKHPTAASWGCGAGYWYKLTPTNDKTYDKDKMIKDANDANDTQVMMFRIIGVLMAWGAIYCMLYPLVAMADVMGDCLDMIPCIGDMLESILEGFVQCVVCAVSCSTGCACALFVIALVWLFMRPLYGAAMMAVCIGLCACSYCVMSQNGDPEQKEKNRRKRKKHKKKHEDESEDAEE